MPSRARRRKLLERASKNPTFRAAVVVRDAARHRAYGMNRRDRRMLAAGSSKARSLLAAMRTELR